MNEQEIKELLATRRWYHTYEILPGIVTPGKTSQCHNLDTILTDLYKMPVDMSGMRVLDIGAYDGMYTFAYESRGADVIGYDIQDPDRTGFDISRKVLNSKAQYIQGSVYDLDPKEIGLFDIVGFFGVYYHLKDARLAFEKIFNIVKPGGMLFFEGECLDNAYKREPKFEENRALLEQINKVLPISYFTSGDYDDHFSNWTVPNQLCLKEWVLSAGFEDVVVDLRKGSTRAFGRCVKKIEEIPLEYPVLDNRIKK
jgi:SAM-dependent methyltransferase